MSEFEMTIEQTDNGWILSYTGHDVLQKTTVHKSWKSVLRELNEYFGWYDINGKLSKTPR